MTSRWAAGSALSATPIASLSRDAATLGQMSGSTSSGGAGNSGSGSESAARARRERMVSIARRRTMVATQVLAVPRLASNDAALRQTAQRRPEQRRPHRLNCGATAGPRRMRFPTFCRRGGRMPRRPPSTRARGHGHRASAGRQRVSAQLEARRAVAGSPRRDRGKRSAIQTSPCPPSACVANSRWRREWTSMPRSLDPAWSNPASVNSPGRPFRTGTIDPGVCCGRGPLS